MKTFLAVLFALAGVGLAQISSLSLPHTIDSAAIPKVSYVDDNDVALKNRLNIVIDSVNADSVRTSLSSNSSLRLTIDADANATGTCVSITHDGATDTIAKFCDDLASQFYGALTGTNLTLSGTAAITGNVSTARINASDSVVGAHLKTVSGNLIVGGTSTLTGVATLTAAPVLSALTASLPVFTNGSSALTTNAMTGTGSVMMSASPTTTGTLTAAAANFSGAATFTAAPIFNAGITLANLSGTMGILRDVTDSYNVISGGSASNTGGNLLLYGSAHATLAGDIQLRNGSTNVLFYDHSATSVTITPATTFTAGITSNLVSTGSSQSILGSSTAPAVAWTETDAGSNAKNWSMLANGGNLTLNIHNDAWNASSIAMRFTRTQHTASGTEIFGTFSIPDLAGSGTRFATVDATGGVSVVATTGSGDAVRATSPTLVTPALGAATATSLVASGNVTADSLVSRKFYGDTTFTLTGTGFSTPPTSTAYVSWIGRVVVMHIPTLSETSNATTFTITGIPTKLRPARTQNAIVSAVTDNTSNTYQGSLDVGTDGVITVYRRTTATTETGVFTASGTKALYYSTITYTLQ